MSRKKDSSVGTVYIWVMMGMLALVGVGCDVEQSPKEKRVSEKKGSSDAKDDEKRLNDNDEDGFDDEEGDEAKNSEEDEDKETNDKTKKDSAGKDDNSKDLKGAVSFQADLKPIVEANCTSRCHTGSFPRIIEEDLSTDQLFIDCGARCIAEVESNSMPRGGSLTPEEKKRFIDWQKGGFKP